ncbi:MAG: hypothetical protein K9L24_01160 [Spirochaetia bacterium]|nr:hypothetical protein [Spirochaetia bacterium]MCF7945450.1 hypothetical protein [Spirochaetia bacterium]
MNILSWSFIQRFLNLPDDLREKTELLNGWITKRGESIMHREIMESERTEKYSGNGRDTILLLCWPVSSVSSVTVDGEVLDPELYYTETDTGVLQRIDGSKFPVGNRNIEITYIGGWTESTLPADIKFAAIEAVSWNLSRLNDNAMGIKSQTTPDGVNVGYELVMPLSVQRVFESYRNVMV